MTIAQVAQVLGARAAGLWRVEGAELVLTEFWASSDLGPGVAEAFRAATTRVPLSRTELGIVAAAIDGTPTVINAGEQPEAGGSGMWLRRFAAGRSIAVPGIVGGAVVGVASVATNDADIDEAIRLLSGLFGR